MNSYDECNYCCDDEMMRDYLMHDGCGGMFISQDNCLENDIEAVLFNQQINYCPMCGRKLQKGEI